jgi:uncharacterized Ntn-hydrolase superfamily protein
MTFSIAARCADTGMLGVAVTSSSICVASRCAHARAGVGAVLTQNVTDPRIGPDGLDLMASGLSSEVALGKIVNDTGNIQYRQLAFLDASGRGVHFTGAKGLGRVAAVVGENCVAVGNLLANDRVPEAIAAGFAASQGHLGWRLIKALQAGLAAGGEEDPVRSVGVVVVDKERWPVVDLRVDWDDLPLTGIETIWQAYEPQIQPYIDRALWPDGAPSFGVAGASSSDVAGGR